LLLHRTFQITDLAKTWFDGKYITVTRRDDGTLRPNFKPMKVDRDFSVYRYALGVFNELMWALEDLIEK
jgi:hypothetical protein